MKAVIIEQQESPFIVREVPIPKPNEKEVLVKIQGTTINPSDELFFKNYAFGVKYPSQIGFEGFGTVTSTGSQETTNLVGKKVSFWSLSARSWAEYTTVPISDIMVMKDDTKLEEGTFAYLNPITCFGLLSLVKKMNHKGAIVSAAVSQCGRILTRLCKEEGINVINIIRNNSQKQICLDNGADVVLNSTDENFYEQVKVESEKLGATIFLDCIGGKFATNVLAGMPFGSELYIYGFLGGESTLPIDALNFFGGNKKIGCFFIDSYTKSISKEECEKLHKKVLETLTKESKTTISDISSLDKINEAVAFYLSNSSKGKILIKV
jgi:NADPH2:quinone reductase